MVMPPLPCRPCHPPLHISLRSLGKKGPSHHLRRQAVAGALSTEEKKALIKQEISRLLRPRPKFEQIGAFELVSEPFSVDDGTLTRTMKIRRPAINAKYAAELEALSHHLR
jgi:long-subunit acyl-CoA synthetase (AMP-forming)